MSETAARYFCQQLYKLKKKCERKLLASFQVLMKGRDWALVALLVTLRGGVGLRQVGRGVGEGGG